MSEMPKPVARFTVVTLGVSDMRRSIAFYDALGFARKLRATGEEVAFFDTGATVLALYPWEKLALDAAIADQPRPAAFRVLHARQLRPSTCATASRKARGCRTGVAADVCAGGTAVHGA